VRVLAVERSAGEDAQQVLVNVDLEVLPAEDPVVEPHVARAQHTRTWAGSWRMVTSE
jgi:hypothetical protein